MQTKSKCKNCVKAIQYGVDNSGKTIFSCKNIFCIFEPVIENPYHIISVLGLSYFNNK